MNKTPNYNLNQWEPEDRVLRTDFNADNAKLDGVLAALSGQVAEKVDQTALEAEIKARTSALAAVNTALNRCGNCRVETFTYTGDGAYGTAGYTTKILRFSAKPAFFMITGVHTIIFGGGPRDPVSCVYSVDGRSGNSNLTASWSGNSVTLTGDGRQVANQSNVQYLAVVFYAEDK